MSRLKWSLTETFLLHPFCTFSSWSQPPSEARITASGPLWKSVCIWVHWFCELGQYRIACLAPSFLYMVSNETLNFVPSRCPLPSYPNPKEEYLFWSKGVGNIEKNIHCIWNLFVKTRSCHQPTFHRSLVGVHLSLELVSLFLSGGLFLTEFLLHHH